MHYIASLEYIHLLINEHVTLKGMFSLGKEPAFPFHFFVYEV